MPLPDGAAFAGYTIVRLLGAGGMGEVYLAEHPRLPRQDALKILTASVTDDGEYRERFDREAAVVAALWHPHIVGVHDRGEYDGKLWISMDYVDGTDAAELLRNNPQGLRPDEVVDIVSAVASALDYAHDRHLLHRDVKPANILLSRPGTPEQRVLLADFGIARRDDDHGGLTATNMTVGTVSYAAPEQLMGAELDGRADQYALAATAFHLLTGAPPFAHSNPAVVISQHLTAVPPKLSRRRPELAHLDAALAKALSKDPADRYTRCVDFARALTHQIGAGTDLTDPSGPVDSTQLAPAARSMHSHRGAGSAKPTWLRPTIVVPIALAVLLVAAVAFAIGQFAGDKEATSADKATTTRTTAPTTTATALPPPPPPSPPTSSSSETDTVTETEVTETEATEAAPTETDSTQAQAATAVVGATCTEPGATGVTADGATTYCANLQYTDRYLWSLNTGVIANPVVISSPAAPPPYEEESPVRICMQQTGHSRLRCAEEILRGNTQ